MLTIDENGFTTVMVDGKPQMRRASYVQAGASCSMFGMGSAHSGREVEPELHENEELIRTIGGDAFILTTR